MTETGVQTETDQMPFNDMCGFVKKFRNDWIPTDRKTYNLLLCTLSVLLSSITFGILVMYLIRGNQPRCLDYAYGTVALFCAYELYQGLNDNVSQKLFFWFLLKFFETGLQFVTFICVLTGVAGTWFLHPQELTTIAFISIVQMCLMYYISKRSKEARRNAEVLESQQVDLDKLLLKKNLNINNIN